MPATPNRLLDAELRDGQYLSSVRFVVVDPDLNRLGELQVLEAGSIAARTSGNVKRTLQGVKITDRVLRDFNPYRDRVKPYWVLEDGTEWPMGVYVVTGDPCTESSYVSVHELQLFDGDQTLDTAVETTFNVPPNGSIMNALDDLANRAGIYRRYIPFDDTAKVLDAVTWPAETPIKRIADELAAKAGYLPPYFDNEGFWTIRQPVDLNNCTADHVYDDARPRVIDGSIVTNDNLLDAPNVFVVVSNGPTQGPIVAVAKVDPALPWSVENRRRRVSDVHREQGLADTAAAQAIANQRAAVTAEQFKTAELDTFPDPRHDLFAIVQWKNVLWRELGFDLTLGPGGPHKHSLSRGGFNPETEAA